MRQIFRSAPYFLPHDDDAVGRLFAEFGVVRHLPKGGVLKREGARRGLFFLQKGLCAYELSDAARAPILSLVTPGCALGDLTAIPGSRCNIRSIALTPVTALEMAPSHWLDAIERRPGFALSTLSGALGKEESIVEGLAANLTLTPSQRLKVFLKAGFANAGRPPVGRFPYILSAETTARCLNLNRVTVAKQLAAWREAGGLRRSGRALIVAPELLNDVYDWLDAPRLGVPPHWGA